MKMNKLTEVKRFETANQARDYVNQKERERNQIKEQRKKK